MYIYVYTYFIHDTHIVFHISFLHVFLFPDVPAGWFVHISKLLEDLDIIEAAHGRHNNTNEPGTEFVAWILDGTSMLIAMLMVVRIWTFVHCQTLRKTQFVMCGTNNVRYFRLFWWHLLESTLIQSGWFSCCFTECALFWSLDYRHLLDQSSHWGSTCCSSWALLVLHPMNQYEITCALCSRPERWMEMVESRVFFHEPIFFWVFLKPLNLFLSISSCDVHHVHDVKSGNLHLAKQL